MALAIPTKLEEPLVRAFDSMVAAGLYQSRSEAIRDAARRLVERSYMSRSDFLRTMAEICGQFILREYEDLVTDLILYGSAAKGQASEDDDLDILVLISKDRTGPSEVEIRVHEITYPVALASASVITPIVLEKKRFLDLLRAGQHFPGEIVRHGIQIKGTIVSELRKRYCVLSCARAALALKDSYPKTHERTLRMFGESFIKAENRPRKMGSNFSRLKALGDKADYSPRIEATKEDAEWSVQVAAEFLEESKSRLKSRL